MIEPPSTPDPNSMAAAASVRMTSARQRWVVFETIRRFQPIAEWQIEQLTGLPGNSVRPRVWELYYKEKSIHRVGKNKTPSGRSAYTYAVNP